MSKFFEDVVLTTAMVLGFLIGVYLSYAVAQGESYPPTLITFFLAIGVSALIYRFMGGLAGTTLKIGLLTLGGTAAFFAGMMILLGDRIREEIDLYSSTEPFRSKIAKLSEERNEVRQRARQLQIEVEELRKRQRGGDCPSAHCSIEDVRAMQPDDPFVLGIKRLVEGQERPFVSTLRELPVRVAVVGGSGRGPAFTICRDKLDELNEDVDVPNPDAQFSRTLSDRTTVTVKARRTGRIGEDVCAAADRDFDVQINCALALELFPDKITSCAEGASLRGSTVEIGALAE